jgi:cell wall-associated NlpC family hydrolase
MKLNPMSPKIAAAILLATLGATLSITPAQAADDNIPADVVQTIDKYDLASFKEPVFETPKVVSWAVAYTPSVSHKAELDPAEKALLSDDAQLAQKQKTIVVKEAAVKRAELERIAAAKAAAEKAEAERVAAAKAEAEKVAAQAAAAAKAEAERVAAEAAQQAARVAAAARTAAAAQSTYNYAAPTNTGTSSASSVTPQTSAVTATPASSKIGAALVASAYSQLGVRQDCTAMVEKALRSVGKSVGDLAPTQFYAYGTVVTNPQPGDLMIMPTHVAIYVGNGMAISGGFNGYDTVLHPVSYIAGSTYVRVS